MNGLIFLKKLMSESPIPVVVISSLTEKSNELTHKAFEYGAVDVITKPKLATREFFNDSKILICDTIKAAAAAKIDKIKIRKDPGIIVPKLSADNMLDVYNNAINIKNTTDKIIALGASTGGTTAIEEFLRSMPPDCPGIAIVQHMPEEFTRSFAERLDKICRISVKEGVQGEIIRPGKAFIAPGNHHMMVTRTGAKYSLEIKDGPLVNRHRPSVDVLFRSVANSAGPNSFGVIMTGMGDDGARGLLEMRQAGAFTIAQDESSCVVFGMPKVAINLDAASMVVPLNDIAKLILQRFSDISD
jgi:two-component system chemotaxis response regulator CheB